MEQMWQGDSVRRTLRRLRLRPCLREQPRSPFPLSADSTSPTSVSRLASPSVRHRLPLDEMSARGLNQGGFAQRPVFAHRHGDALPRIARLHVAARVRQVAGLPAEWKQEEAGPHLESGLSLNFGRFRRFSAGEGEGVPSSRTPLRVAIARTCLQNPHECAKASSETLRWQLTHTSRNPVHKQLVCRGRKPIRKSYVARRIATLHPFPQRQLMPRCRPRRVRAAAAAI